MKIKTRSYDDGKEKVTISVEVAAKKPRIKIVGRHRKYQKIPNRNGTERECLQSNRESERSVFLDLDFNWNSIFVQSFHYRYKYSRYQ